MSNSIAAKIVHRFLRISRADTESCIGPLLEFPFSIAVDSNDCWLRYSADHELCRKAAVNIPAEHFFSHSGTQLIRDGETVASKTLPNLQWMPLKEYVEVQLPKALLAGRLQIQQMDTWTLKRGGSERDAEAALYDPTSLLPWLSGAPHTRLSPLKFCVADLTYQDTPSDHKPNRSLVFIIGKPLPPIPCQFFYRIGPVFVPVGYRWVPALDVSLVEKSFGLAKNQWLLWTLDLGFSIIPQQQFIPLSRAALRAMFEENPRNS
jgi:hypothetical protein